MVIILVAGMSGTMRKYNPSKFVEAKKESLSKQYEKLVAVEPVALKYAPLSVDWSDAEFELRLVDTPEMKSVHNYFYQVISSFPNKANDAGGLHWFYNLWETRSSSIVGILRISSDFLALGPRDRLLGKVDPKNQRTLQLKGVIPLPPFSRLAGGKLLAALAFSDEVTSDLRKKVDLVGISVCAIYGESIIYDRIPWLKYLGETAKGTGVYFGRTDKSVPASEVLKWWRPLYERRLSKQNTKVGEEVFRVSKILGRNRGSLDDYAM